MPYRKVPLVVGEVYHVYNRSVARQQIFLTKRDYQRALEALYFYTFAKPNLRFSRFDQLPVDQKTDFLNKLKTNGVKQIELLAFCLMPNHLHFLVKEIQNNGISAFMRIFQNSSAKHFNIKTKRSGALFQAMFKAVRIETDEQLVHVCRYIHLNPLSAYIIKDISELEFYQWCSFANYIDNSDLEIVNTKLISSFFKTMAEFKKFHYDQVDYQRKLESIKHLILE